MREHMQREKRSSIYKDRVGYIFFRGGDGGRYTWGSIKNIAFIFFQ